MAGILKIGTPSTQINQYMHLVGPSSLSKPRYSGIVTFNGNKMKVSTADGKNNILWKNIATENYVSDLVAQSIGASIIINFEMADYTVARYKLTHNLRTSNPLSVNLYINNELCNNLIYSCLSNSNTELVISFTRNIPVGSMITITELHTGSITNIQSMPPDPHA